MDTPERQDIQYNSDMKTYITRITAGKLAKVILHDMCERIGHYPFQYGYSYTCNGQRIAVKAGKFVENRRAGVFGCERLMLIRLCLLRLIKI